MLLRRHTTVRHSRIIDKRYGIRCALYIRYEFHTGAILLLLFVCSSIFGRKNTLCIAFYHQLPFHAVCQLVVSRRPSGYIQDNE